MSEQRPTTASLDASSTGFTLWRAAMRWLHAANHALADVGLTHAQLILLSGIKDLSADASPITQTRLSAHTSTDVMMTSKTLRVLEDRGLVERRHHPSDTRARSIVLTKDGAAHLKKGLRIVAKLEETLVADAPSAERLRRSLIALSPGA